MVLFQSACLENTGFVGGIWVKEMSTSPIDSACEESQGGGEREGEREREREGGGGRVRKREAKNSNNIS